MRGNINYIGKVVFLSFGLMLVGNCYIYGQQYSVEKQKEEFAKGNKDLRFLKEYIDSLKADSIKDGVDVVLERYLSNLPFEQRYSVENVKDIVTYINGVDEVIWVDIIKNWNKLPLSEEQKRVLMNKLDQNSSTVMFSWLTNREKDPELERPDLSGIQLALIGTNIPLSLSKKILINMWQSENDIPKMVDLTRQMFSGSFALSGVLDWFVFVDRLNYLLEHTNADQCNVMLEILEMGMEKHKENMMISTVKGIKDNFEGKKLMFEMDEE